MIKKAKEIYEDVVYNRLNLNKKFVDLSELNKLIDIMKEEITDEQINNGDKSSCCGWMAALIDLKERIK